MEQVFFSNVLYGEVNYHTEYHIAATDQTCTVFIRNSNRRDEFNSSQVCPINLRAKPL